MYDPTFALVLAHQRDLLAEASRDHRAARLAGPRRARFAELRDRFAVRRTPAAECATC